MVARFETTSRKLADATSLRQSSTLQSLGVVLVFAATLSLSAFLLFTVELIVAKAVLPTLGGVPMVWNTCMVFFQAVLLAGYLYGHGAISWMGPRRHAIVYAVLVAIPLFFLPFSTHVSDPKPPGGNPVGWLMLLLLGWIGIPFFVLATSAAVLQKGFSTAARSRDPYFLYAASNLGSLLALVCYPTLVERLLPLRDQSRIWAFAYVAFVVGACACAGITLYRGAFLPGDGAAAKIDDRSPAARRLPIANRRRARWVALSFVPSSLMLAVTTYLSTDIAAVPLLWMVPLSLYLITFVLTFGSRSRSVTALIDRVLPLVVLPLVLLMVIQQPTALWMSIPIHLIVFTVAALLCHGQLADDRPSPASLTEFYFWIAFGGMLGGLFNALAAPVLFSTVVEYPLVLVIACLLRVGGPKTGPSRRSMDLAVPVAVALLTAGAIFGVRSSGANPRLIVAALAVPAFVSFSQSRRHPIRFAVSVGAMLLTGAVFGGARDGTLHTERTFYGVYRVGLEYSGQYRALFNGTTLHGMQAVDPARQREPLTYYDRTGPFGEAAARLPAMARAGDIAVVGLGVGSLASYATSGQLWTFFELDPAVEQLARSDRYFTYLRDCGERCRVVLGDARISLARERPGQYGAIVLDAFSSDSIPVHLLTSEAIALYLSRLADGGVLALHVSNRHLALSPVIAGLAHRYALTAVERLDGRVTQAETLRGKSPSDWILIGRHAADLAPLVSDPKWTQLVASSSTPLWTDDSSSILSVLRFR